MRLESNRWLVRAVLALVVCILASPAGRAQLPGDGERPGPCGAECIRKAAEAALACGRAGGGLLECAEVFAAELKACREAAGCENPDPPDRPPLCGEDCLKAARDAAIACRDAGGEIEACFSEVKAQLKACLDAAGCELPDLPDRPPHCGAGCLREAVTAARDCLKNGGGLRECAGVFRSTLEACRDAAGCSGGEEPPPDEDAQLLGLLLEETFLRGDANKDGVIDISDPIAVLGFLFLGSTPPGCMDAADANDDGGVDISDPAAALSSLFQGRGSLPEPYPVAGFDPTEDDLGCGLPSS